MFVKRWTSSNIIGKRSARRQWALGVALVCCSADINVVRMNGALSGMV